MSQCLQTARRDLKGNHLWDTRRTVPGNLQLQLPYAHLEMGVRILGRDRQELVCPRAAATAISAAAYRDHHAGLLVIHPRLDMPRRRRAAQRNCGDGRRSLLAHEGFPVDTDVRDHFRLDQQHRLVDVNLLFDPMFEVQIIEENERTLKYRDIDGVKRIFLKEEATIPTAYQWPVSGWESWRRLEERLNVKNIAGRFPRHWPRLVEEYRNRDYPLAIGGYPQGFFGTLVHLLGYENVFVWYHEEPALIHRHPRHVHGNMDRRVRRGIGPGRDR